MKAGTKVTARYEAVADAFRAARRESSLLIELGRRRIEAAMMATPATDSTTTGGRSAPAKGSP